MTPKRVLLMMSALLATACGSSSPTAPTPESSVVVAYGQTVTPPGTELRISLRGTYIWGPAAIECLRGAECNYSPSAMIEAEVPGLKPENFSPHIPNPMGGEEFTYGGYRVRVNGFDPAWDEKAPLDSRAYKVLLTVSGQ